MRRLFGLFFSLFCFCLFFLAKSNTVFAAAQCDSNKFLLIGDSISDGLAKAMGIQADWTNPDTMTANKYDSAFPYATTAWFTGAQFPTSDQLPGITQDYYAPYRSKGITAKAVMNTILGNTDAKVAVIMLGTNDCTKLDINTFKSNLTSIVESVKGKNIIPILSTIPPRMSNAPQCAGGTDAWNNTITDVANSEGIQIRDAFGALQDPNNFNGNGGDGLHPTTYDSLVVSTKAVLNQVCGGSSTSSGNSGSSTNIGTHLIAFDPGQQIKVLQALSSKSLPIHYPIVVNIDASEPALFTNLAKAASDAKFSPIVRITSISPSTNPGLMPALATFIATNFPPGTPVEFGNEIENSKEWSGTMTQYAKLFDVFASALPPSYPLGIATLNTSNANTDVAPLFSQIINSLAATSKSRISAVFANVYILASCNPTYNSDRCNTKTGSWVLQQMNTLLGNRFTNNDLYITELGNLTCTSYDCLQTFYEDNDSLPAKLKVGFSTIPGGAAFIHTVPGICEYWDQTSLTPHKPTRCSKSQPNGIYIYPGIDDITDTQSQLDMASKYTMTCAPRLQFSGEIQNQDLVPGKNISIPGVSGTAYINHSGSTIPLYRFDGASLPNNTSSSRRLDDLEGYFSAKYSVEQGTNISPQTATDPNVFLAQGTQSKVLSKTALCQSTVQFLQSIKSLCDNEPKKYNTLNPQDKSAKPFIPLPAPRPAGDPCPLDFVVHTPSGTKSYLDILKEKPSNSCTSSDTSIFSEDIDYVENTTPKAFKPAYLVHYTDYPQDNSNILSTLQGWLAPTPTNDGKTRVQITKIFVPANVASTTNGQNLPLPSQDNSSFTSGFMNTTLSILSRQSQDTITKNQIGDEKNILQKIGSSNLLVPDGSDPLNSRYINCFECGNNQFVNTIVKRINAQIQSGGDNGDCSAGDLIGEKADQRKSSINPTGNPDPIHEISVTANATLTTNLASGPALSTRTFLLLPEEYRNVTDYEDLLARSLLPETYANTIFANGTNLKNSDVPNYGKSFKFLQLNDTKPLANNGLTIHESAPETKGPIVGYSKDVPPKPLSLIGTIAATDISSFDINPTVPGGRLARGLWELACHVVQPFISTKKFAPYQGLEKLLQQGSAACFVDSSAPVCKQPTLQSIGGGFLVTAPVGSTLITSTPSEFGQKSCDWAKGKGLAYAINANFGHGATSPIGPFGFNGNITDAPPENNDTMSFVVEKSGEAHVYDWNGRSGGRADKKGKPDLSNVNFIVTGVYYDNFRAPYDGVMDRTAIGLKDGQLYIRSFAATPAGVRDAMSQLGIDDGHFVMLDGDSVSQLCKGNTDGTMTQIFPDPTNSDIIAAKYPFAVAVSMGIGGSSASGGTCDSTQNIANNTSSLSEFFQQIKNFLVPGETQLTKNCGLTYVTSDQAQTYAQELLQSVPPQQHSSSFGHGNGWEGYYSGYYPTEQQQLFGACGGNPSCLKFILDTVTSTPICNSTTRLNPYIAISIALNETGGLRNQPGTNHNQHFGCKMASFVSYNNATINGLACSVKTANNKQVLNPILGPPISSNDYATCVPESSASNRSDIEFDNTVEDGLACMLARFNSYCRPVAGSQNDVQAMNSYGYSSLENIVGVVMNFLNPSRAQQFLHQCTN